MPRGFTIQITHSITQAESSFMEVLSNHTCTGIINDKTMPHFIYIKYKNLDTMYLGLGLTLTE